MPITSYTRTHPDDPLVKKFCDLSSVLGGTRKKRKEDGLHNFEPYQLPVQLTAVWLISMRYCGLTSDSENYCERWDFKQRRKQEAELQGPAQQTCELLCTIREGPESSGTDQEYKGMETFVGLPTSKDVEKYV